MKLTVRRRGSPGRPGDGGAAPTRKQSAALLDVTALEEERDFLLRSLRDLEAEWQAGDIDDVDYHALKDDYTARAASVLRQLGSAGAEVPPAGSGPEVAAGTPVAAEAGTPVTAGTPVPDGTVLPPGDASVGGQAGSSRRQRRASARPPWRWWQKVMALVIVMALGGLTGWGVHRATSNRQPGQTITGSIQDPATLGSDLAAAQNDINNQKFLDALKIYRAILAVQPNQPEALTYQGWLLALAGFVDQGMAALDKAERVAPSYPDAHLFRGVILLRNKHQPAEAIKELEAYLATHPPAAAATMAKGAIAQARADEAKAGSAKTGSTAGGSGTPGSQGTATPGSSSPTTTAGG